MIALLRATDAFPDPRVEKEAESIVSAGYDAHVFAWDRNGRFDTSEMLLKPGSRVRISRFGHKSAYGQGVRNLAGLVLFQVFLVRQLWKIRDKLQAIHACDLSTGVSAACVAKALRVPFVYDIYDYYADAFPVPKPLIPLVKRLETTVINCADATILTTEARFRQIDPAVPKRVVYIHNSPVALQGKEARQRTKVDSEESTFVYVGILTEGRLLPEILRVFEKHPEWHLLIAGYGPLSGLVSESAEKTPNITFLGVVDYNSALQATAAADFMFAVYNPVVPNHEYSSPNKFYESLMLGKPIIVAKGTGVDELVRDAGSGVAIDYSEDAFEQAAASLSENRAFGREVASRAPQMFEQKYSWELMETRLIALYESLLGPRSAAEG